MDRKTLIAVGAAAAVTLLVNNGIQWFLDTSSSGMDAIEEKRIEAILQERLTLPDGKSYSEVITNLDKNVAVLSTNVDNIDKNLDLMRGALEQIASDE